ncbi:class I SAM-dependent methyltransferase [Marinobacter sp.]|uniref:class I SAM-dependent methyltransferase n=1 Tax=Marinobacter sp. TaxID=50741 RepID=UPI002B45EBD2|nr:class I SAM-dependent methyltransferase [Marinobacter sp.]HKK55484.1 class I SAM-dependent methyltransferase [Marinobacter sp.]
MSAMPNSHQALLKNRECVSGRLALIGPTDPGLLQQIAGDGLAMTENMGIFGLLQANEPWTVSFGYDHPALVPDCADTVVIFVPKSRAEMSMRLALARSLTRKNGRVIVVGEKKEGIAGAVRQLRELFPQSEKIDSVRHCQVWQADTLPPSPAFWVSDWLQWHGVEHGSIRLDVAALPGIFSDGELDAGTAMLLDTLGRIPLDSGRILDFGCGAGVIGCWWQRLQAQRGDPISSVDGVDAQFQAVACARATYNRAGAEGNIIASDGLANVEGQYQSVVTNPPFHSGIRTDTSVTERFLQGINRHLVKGGELRLVANRFLPYQALIRQHLGPVKVLAEDHRFTVWSARKG